MNIAVVGLSHKTAPIEVREKLSIPEAQIEGAIAHLLSYPHVDEVTILSTCNRLEIYIVSSETTQGINEVTQFLSEHSKLPIISLRHHLFMLLHTDAVTHVLRVSAGLDSLVLGEGQILAQVKHTHKLGQQFNGIKTILNRLFKQALTAGKRVRTETSIGTGAVSISSAAVELAQMKVGNLSTYRISILGAGKMSRLLVQHLISKGANHISIVNRSRGRAEELVKLFPEQPIQIHLLSATMSIIAESDIVFTSTSSTEPILDRAKLETVLEPNQKLMLFDISVPRNVDADVNDLANVKAFNVDDLKAVVAQNYESRRQMAQEAEKILDEEVEAFDVWWRSLETVSTISSLRNKIEAIREQELEKALSRLGSEFGEKHQEVIEALTRGIVNKILHDPMVQLRAQQDVEARRRCMQTLQMLFNLETEFS
ncbi:glutamyl-tRNA reductase [Aphanizomenon flos-aquae NRERC-008]|jgi:glutamyl-tRNA reductase|uniref:Glutamyl-tRNA reductase n=1 Tax=Aphanizomenon flos-aquae FACHB-1249 TaxID=2692889 RepID=A0ABR8IKC0_APHFL|nr:MULTISPECIES: glutamyl-tRNA reductase [Aphanizomenon]MCE2905181.1 glutamyl-tRNA reductase [Anabaena sp. CoA2_C59]MDJ0504693.1 glutamyl-tRNA reductase [Nostocales cyanobacterium LE14-WE12]MBD2388947.1 glutamyl-tRNA reductase [Aphanizomenon flos-aquae FACHB-1171]MBD2555525.1 glutamyl-tRNA reductase [Aphanizomenon flos-aquae FACHB-1290]MBD2629960.1 glutamyl-tRNA reductase [Aphanizomenon sp. FACHB-1399]